MKSNEEMLYSVLNRAKEERARQKLVHRTAISAAACFCIIAIAALGIARLWKPEVDQPPILSTENTGKSRLSVFTVNAAEYKTMIEGVDIPQGFIRVRDVSENTQMEKVFIRREMLAEGETYGEDVFVRTITCRESEDTIIVVAFAERLMVITEDIEQVVEYSASSKVDGVCSCAINPGKDNATGEIYRGIEVFWRPPSEYFDKLLESAEKKLSELEDTIVVTVKFADGSTESVTVDINADDEGKIYMTYRGAK